METKILTDYIKNADNDETEEAAIVITATDNADSQSNGEDTGRAISRDTKDSVDTTYLDERGNVEDDEITRITYESKYNLSPSLSYDGKLLLFLAQDQGKFKVAIQNLLSNQVLKYLHSFLEL